MQSFVQRVQDLPPILGALAKALDDENVPRLIAKGLELAHAVYSLIEESEKLANAIRLCLVPASHPRNSTNSPTNYRRGSSTISLPGASKGLPAG